MTPAMPSDEDFNGKGFTEIVPELFCHSIGA